MAKEDKTELLNWVKAKMLIHTITLQLVVLKDCDNPEVIRDWLKLMLDLANEMCDA